MSGVIAQRILIDTLPFPDHARQQGKPPWQIVPEWPARWLDLPGGQGFALYRLTIGLERPLAARIHVSADERYEFYIDGELVGRGSERGDGANWFFETFDLSLTSGSHTFVARVWALGSAAPWAQVSVRPGWLLAAEGSAGQLLSTGHAPWEVQSLPGITWAAQDEQLKSSLGCGPGFVFDCALLGQGGTWQPAALGELPATWGGSVFVGPGRHYLRPAMLAPQLNRPWSGMQVRYAAFEDLIAQPLKPVGAQTDSALGDAIQAMLTGSRPMRVESNISFRAIVDLGDYVCHYPSLTLQGGAGSQIRLRHAESLWQDADRRAREGLGDVTGRVFRGLVDEVRPDGRAHAITMPWWRCGRFVQLEVCTAGEPLEITGLSFTETRYDISPQFRFESSDTQMSAIARVSLRTAQMCAHETYMDCPYYEQLQYVGDTRLQMLLGYLLNPDDRLQRKALVMFDASRANASGLVLDAYPGQGKLIPPFALWWIGCLHDFARWRGDRAFIASLMPGAREVMERFIQQLDRDCLLVSPPGWNYVDVADGFEYGVPPGGQAGGRSGVLQMQMACALSYMEDLDEWLGEYALKQRWRSWAERMVAAAQSCYWDAHRGMFADDLGKTRFSQHAQVLAIMTGLVSGDTGESLCDRLLHDAGLTQCNIYFSHYLFDVLSAFDLVDEVRHRYGAWGDLVARGYSTFPEHFGYTRSECHAWSSHLLCHYIRHVLGYATLGWGGDEISFSPRLRDGERVRIALAHRRGMLDVELKSDGGAVSGRIVVPRGVKCHAPMVEVAVRR